MAIIGYWAFDNGTFFVGGLLAVGSLFVGGFVTMGPLFATGFRKGGTVIL